MMTPPIHLAPMEIRDYSGHSCVRHGEVYLPLLFADGTPRAAVAVYLYDEIGVRQRLVELGYRVGDSVTAVRR